MNNYFSLLTAMTGDNSKMPLVAICLVISIVLMAALIIIGKVSDSKDDSDDEDDEDTKE